MVRHTAMARELRARGLRLTSQRLAIIKVLLEADEHLTPAEVLERGIGACPGLGLTTVYRTLELLRESGQVQRVHLEEGCHGYARVQEREGHHLVCQACHRVVGFPCTGLTDLVEETAQRTGFSVESHLLELVGLCPECQEADPGRRNAAGEAGNPSSG